MVPVWLIATHDRYVRHSCIISWPGRHFALPAKWGRNDVGCLRLPSAGGGAFLMQKRRWQVTLKVQFSGV